MILAKSHTVEEIASPTSPAPRWHRHQSQDRTIQLIEQKAQADMYPLLIVEAVAE